MNEAAIFLYSLSTTKSCISMCLFLKISSTQPEVAHI
jgi:hypothetical protein